MKKIVEIFQFVKSKLNKYWIAIIIGFVLTFLVGEHKISNRISYDVQINQLRNKIEYYTQQNEEHRRKLKELHSDNESLEKLAREQYQMVKPDEDLYIIKE
jgi:cell division protein FtsB